MTAATARATKSSSGKPGRDSGARSNRGAGLWLAGLVCGLGAALAPGHLAMGAILLAPGVLAWAASDNAGRAASRPVLLIGAAMAILPLTTLGAHTGVTAAVGLACAPRTLALAWSVQGAAWLAAEMLPWLIRLLLDGAAKAQTKALRRARRELEGEWALPPAADEPH